MEETPILFTCLMCIISSTVRFRKSLPSTPPSLHILQPPAAGLMALLLPANKRDSSLPRTPLLFPQSADPQIYTLLANCQRNRLAIACRHNSGCYIAEVFTFIALLLISCDSLALSHQTTCFYIDKNFISDCLETTTLCSYAMQGTT